MSLVNYGSSDESSGSEEDSVHVENVSRPRPKPTRDSEVEVEQRTSPAPSPGSKLSDTSAGLGLDMVVGPTARNEARTVGGGEPIRKQSLLSSLPPPKSSKPRKEFSEIKNDPGTKNVAEIDSSTNIKRSFLNLPPPRKKSQTVKITLPTLPDPGSDEDDNEPVAKKPTPSKGVSGLLSMLPKPKSAMSSRILVPHTVSRKPQPQKLKPQIKPSPKTNSTAVASVISVDYDSDDNDDDNEGNSFFSLGVSSSLPEVSSSNKDDEKLGSKISLPSLPPATSNTNYLSADSSNIRNLPKPTVNVRNNVNMLPESSTSPSKSSSVCSKENPTTTISSSISTRTYDDASIAGASSTDVNSYNALSSMANVEPDDNSSNITNVADAPLSFNKSHSSTNSGYGHVTSSYYDYSGNYYQAGQSAYEYNQPYQDTSGYQDSADSTEVGCMQQEVLEDVNEDDEQLRRFLGKHGNKDDINMISINADDQTAGSNSREALLKSISEEKQPMTYSKKKNSDLPSSQQRRKHQITYLAFQAKERELALKNQWSQNRMTRKQTQAKYGF